VGQDYYFGDVEIFLTADSSKTSVFLIDLRADLQIIVKALPVGSPVTSINITGCQVVQNVSYTEVMATIKTQCERLGAQFDINSKNCSFVSVHANKSCGAGDYYFHLSIFLT
jgi:hypothetical protein